ncbi:probable lipoxygenase 8, chloroplastic [Dendrobium catenatum]|uniref:Lipoxygenase n=1 Tax=Dendrobium catenatum TaxID=906689 RepID=A0A2I0VYN8_9ASPA|nr:probable lipoxygenase 8, chloroplastic [Dendrobium catenatum]PKU68520.1 putative lipoxygenase 8, chloroplastic [Dendrobium catenatum]
MKAVATVKLTAGETLGCIDLSRVIDGFVDLFRGNLYMEFVGTELDHSSGLEKTVAVNAHKKSKEGEDVQYEASFTVPSDFGEIGGVLVLNENHKEIFLKDIVITTDYTVGENFSVITCNSWVQAKSTSSEKRIFFTNKSYLPSSTPSGLQRLRRKDLEAKRGDGHGERKAYERIYDYDTYNDLGDPDSNEDLARPILGGSRQYPYPRRCRTGRPPSHNDPLSESKGSSIYVPRDEAFSEVKTLTFNGKTLTSVLHAIIPAVNSALIDINVGFKNFIDIDELYDQGFKVPDNVHGPKALLHKLCNSIKDTADDVLQFEIPSLIKNDKFSWLRDEEFARQTLAGVNPYAIELVKELPLISKLDPIIYGPPESAITEEIIEREIHGEMTASEAMQRKRLFMLDYHDLFLPFVHKVRELQGTTLYGSRTLFFLKSNNTLTPIAIELTRPQSPQNPQWKQVFTPSSDATLNWLWRFAKAHVCAHDSGYHELISHWLRTHGSVEPYIIAGNRQLSVIHPIYRLLHPHFRYTMKINALARKYLISGGGIIEMSFSTLKYSMELSSAAYDQIWRFDREGLPADLIKRGMAEKDSEAEHGLRLAISDYPFAADGLLIWSAISDWVSSYVAHYYPQPSTVSDDVELQSFWTEVRTRGHADKKDEPWWPKLTDSTVLADVLTTIIWVASAHHAAVNFGQYDYGGYFPNRPTIARTPMPTEQDISGHSGGFEKFVEKPEETLMECFPSQIQATIVMAVLDVLSNHSPDEEYLGAAAEAAWEEDSVLRAAFERFNGRLKEIEGIIDERNGDVGLRNRKGAGVLAYELMKPFSAAGVTGRGIPNSTSI